MFLKPILLKAILFEALNLENDDADVSLTPPTDSDITSRTLKDDFELTNTGLEYVKAELDKLNKKAKRIGSPPLEIKIVSEFDKDVVVSGVKTKAHFFKVRVDGKSPIIDGYEFIASIEHAEEGNIVNMCPTSSIPRLPSEYLTTKNTCDFCHTKRDRLNTFILRKTDGGQLMKVGRSCLKNFLPGKNPAGILAYGESLSNALRAMVAGENMEDYDSGGGSGWGRYYPAETYLRHVCLAYLIEGKFISSKKAKDAAMEGDNIQSTAQFAWFLMETVRKLQNPNDQRTWEAKINSKQAAADKLYTDLEKWIETKDWDVEIDKNQETNPSLAQYFHNLKVIAKSSTISRKNSNLHASILGNYLREVGEAEKKAKAATKTPSKFMGQIGEKVEFIGTVVNTKQFDGTYGVTTLIAFEDAEGNEYVWWASGAHDIEKGSKFVVKATVKKHEISRYNNQQQTTITRAKLTPV